MAASASSLFPTKKIPVWDEEREAVVGDGYCGVGKEPAWVFPEVKGFHKGTAKG